MATRDLAQKLHPVSPAAGPAKKVNGKAIPVWETLLQIAAEVPESEAQKIPHDAAEQLDHYLYGSPKQVKSRKRASG